MPTLEDPVLTAYQVDTAYQTVEYHELVYDISGFFSPIAIRDQILRAATLVERAYENNLIKPGSRPLLIIGGSFAGVVAALKAVSYGVKTVIVEREDVFVKFLHGSRHRYTSLSQYDWPAKHWKEEVYPWKECKTIPVELKDGMTNAITNLLINQFNKAKDLPDPLGTDESQKILIPLPSTTYVKQSITVDTASEVEGRPLLVANLTIDDDVSAEVSNLPDRYGMAISCIGFGSEKTYIPQKPLPEGTYVGAEFWRINLMEDTPLSDYKTVIGGAGDGALQDFLLLVTKKQSAREIFEAIDFPLKLRSGIEKELSYWEDTAHRRALWQGSSSKIRRHRIYSELQEKHLELIEKIFNCQDQSELDKFKNSIEKVLVSQAETGNVKMVIECEHLSGFYPLNRFLTLLILTYLEKVRKQEVLVKNTRINVVEPVNSDHSCGNYVKCLDEKHNVRGYRMTCDSPDETKSYKIPGSPFEHVILRFGIIKVDPLFDFPPRLSGLQTLPYIP
jgi:hypothetical protein